MANYVQITFDADDPPALAQFWALALDYQLQSPPPGFDTWDDVADVQGVAPEDRSNYGAVVDPAGQGPRLLFPKVPEGKAAKNRVHLDVGVADTAGHATTLLEAGATHVADVEEFGSAWTVLQDPEGNEFCVVPRPGSGGDPQP
ncbi:MAG: VOC family protein [Acidimicrobiales bacterium]